MIQSRDHKRENGNRRKDNNNDTKNNYSPTPFSPNTSLNDGSGRISSSTNYSQHEHSLSEYIKTVKA